MTRAGKITPVAWGLSRVGAWFFGARRCGLLLVSAGLLSLPGRAQTDSASVPRSSFRPMPAAVLTLSGGLGAPYGNGLDLGYRLTRRLEVTVGAGYDFSGYKAGIGGLYFLFEEHRVATFIGANLAYSGGRGDVLVHTNEDYGNGADETARIRIHSAVIARLRAGARWQASRRFGILTALGHGLAFGPDPVQYLSSTPPSAGLREVVNTRRPDSLELSLAVAVQLGP